MTSLDHRVIEDPYDRGTQRLAAVDADEDRSAGVPAPAAQQIGDDGWCPRLTLRPSRAGAWCVDPDAQQKYAQVITEAHAVDHRRN